MSNDVSRCGWCLTSPLYMDYHDREWGVVVHDDRVLAESLLLEVAHAGLSWILILNKRENYRRAFDDFQLDKMAKYNEKKILALLNDEGIVRHRAKIEAFITNAKAILAIQEKWGSFDRYIWQFAPTKSFSRRLNDYKLLPSTSKESELMSRDLKAQGFVFVGPTTCYSFMQAVGMVDDHVSSCFRAKNK